MKRNLFLFLLAYTVSSCTSINHGNDEVAIYQDATERRYVPLKNLDNIDKEGHLDLVHEIAVLSESIYRSSPSTDNDIEKNCAEFAISDENNGLKMPIPQGWSKISDAMPISTKDWWILGESDGMKIEVWRRDFHDQENIVAIVFRGTDFDELDDWYSNLRWITRLNPFFRDQYDQTRRLIPRLVAKLRSAFPDARIVSTGHSLGGGLAQQAAYISDQISEVYAFAPSVVTGYFSIRRAPRKVNSQGVTIYRIYEKGEILGYVRGFMRRISPLTKANPKLIEIGFNFSDGNSLTQHSMKRLACGLHDTFN